MEVQYSLKRNSFMIFTIDFLKVIFFGILFIAIPLYKASYVASVTASAIVLFAAIIVGIMSLKDNNDYIVITDKTISLCKKKKNQFEVLKQFSEDNIKNIIISNELKAVVIESMNEELTTLFNFKSIKSMYNELFFKISASLYKNFPSKFEDVNENINTFNETNVIPECIKKADTSSKFQTIFYIIFLSVLSFLPLCLTLLSIGWIICQCVLFILEIILSAIK